MPIAANQHQLSAERVRGIYADSPWWVRVEQSLRPRVYPFEHLVAAVPEGARVFHAGCGPGLLLGLLALADLRITGVGFDTNPNFIGYARMMACRVRDTGSTLRFERSDHTDTWPEGTFDVVCLVDLLHHLPANEQKRLFDEAVAAIRPGGLLIYKDMCTRPRWRAAAHRLHDLFLTRQWIHHVSADVEDWASSRGLEVASRAFAPRLWFGHELRVFRRPPSTDDGGLGSTHV